MASIHHRAKRRAEAFENLEKARVAVAIHLDVDVNAPVMPGVIARDPDLRAIAEIESVVELLQAVDSQLGASGAQDEGLSEILEEFRTILTPFNRPKEDGEDETLIETLYRLISDRAAYMGGCLEKAREIATASGVEFTLTADSPPSSIYLSGVIEPMAAHIADLQCELEAARLRAETAEAKVAEAPVETESDTAGDSKTAPKKSK